MTEQLTVSGDLRAPGPPEPVPTTSPRPPAPRVRPERRAARRRWHAEVSLDALGVVAESVTHLVGFESASVLVVRDCALECVAAAGEAGGAALGDLTPLEDLAPLLPRAAEVERPLFVWRRLEDGRAGAAAPARRSRGARQVLVGLHDDTGVLRGVLQAVVPAGTRRPRAAQLRILEHHVLQARRAVLNALEREELSDRLAMSRVARLAVRTATTGLSLDRLVEECRTALTTAFGAREVWLRLADDPQSGVTRPGDPGTPTLLRPLLERLQREAWERQESVLLGPGMRLPPGLGAAESLAIDAAMAERGVGSVLLAPLGCGEECLGRLVLLRYRDDPAWTAIDAESALDAGHDLGRAVLNARAYEHEHELVEQLRALDVYKNRLIATVAHELKTPLTSVVGNLELLGDLAAHPAAHPAADPVTDPAAAAAPDILGKAQRGAARLSDLVDDLLLLSRVADDRAPLSLSAVDLGTIARDVHDLTQAVAARREQRVVLDLPDGPVLALGDRRQLDRVAANLVSNALKYSRPGHDVVLTCRRRGDEAVLTCADQGIGISEEDRRHLFREFFRSEDPWTQRQGGTGLGLSIVERIVHRHHGTVEVHSLPGLGSTFTVRLPAAPPDADDPPRSA